jgi:hypothetical protein
MTESAYWALGGFAGVVAVAALFAGDVVVAIAAAVVAAILFPWAYRSPPRR